MSQVAEDRWPRIAHVAGVILGISLILRSTGVPLHDEIAHYVLARDAWKDPSLLLDGWGRPTNTLLYVLPAWYGWAATRFASLFYALLIALTTHRIARALELPGERWVPFFLWTQPLFLTFSYTCMTEVPFTLVITGALAATLGRHLVLAGFLMGCLPMARYEGLLLTGLYLAWLLYRRETRAIAAAALPMLLYNGLHRELLGTWPFDIFSRPHITRFYGSGGPFHYFKYLIGTSAGCGPLMLVLASWAIPALLARPSRVLVSGMFATYFCAHVILYTAGLFGASGYGVFLLPVAPALALAAAAGLAALAPAAGAALESSTGRSRSLCNQVVLMIIVIAQGTFALTVPPHRIDEQGRAMEEVALLLRKPGLADRPVRASHAWLSHWYPAVSYRSTLQDNPGLDNLPPGTILVWDRQYSERRGYSLPEIQRRPDFRALADFQNGFARVFEKWPPRP